MEISTFKHVVTFRPYFAKVNQSHNQIINKPLQQPKLNKPFNWAERIALGLLSFVLSLIQSILPNFLQIALIPFEVTALRNPAYLNRRKSTMIQDLKWWKIDPETPIGQYLVDPYGWVFKKLNSLLYMFKSFSSKRMS